MAPVRTNAQVSKRSRAKEPYQNPTKPVPPPRNPIKKPATKPLKMQKPIFKHLTLSIAGTIRKMSGDIVPHEDIARWWTVHGGTFEREVTNYTTHLICSIEEYKKKGPQVLKAWEFADRNNQCKIVVFDWLEDCLIKGKCKRKRVEKGYTLDRTIARLKKGKTDHTKFRDSFEEGVRAHKELCNSKLHQVHYDKCGFEYKITLSRIEATTPKVRHEKYTLFLFESIAVPHTYMTGAKFSRPYRPVSFYNSECRPKEFIEAMRDFKHFFFDKTGIVWDDRLEGINKESEGKFFYKPPVLGRPVGILPEGYIRPEFRQGWKPQHEIEGEEMVEDAKQLVLDDDIVYDTDSNAGDSDDEGDSGETAEYLTEEMSQERKFAADNYNHEPICLTDSQASEEEAEEDDRGMDMEVEEPEETEKSERPKEPKEPKKTRKT